jgi:hypothetical protein
MIIQEVVSTPIITSIGATPSKFKIKASAKAFKVLSGFYSEPVLAIPRELGANAWDAHVKAGNTKVMFEVHAPNNLEPWFSIRDFGTGLSPEDIDQIYTTYFESTKTNDNDSDGCMGLGSKTPFNYTDTFSVVSYFNGVKYVYNCFIDETGSPNILPVASEETKEHNGLEVKFGVKITDITMFVDKITRAYEPFRFRPIIKGASITFTPREYAFQGMNWAMKKNSDRYHHNGCRAFMGNYSYPISYDGVKNYISDLGKENRTVYNLFNNGEFDFFFDIGDLEVAPNKETLQYDADNKTARAIVERCEVAFKKLQTMVEASLTVPKTRWEAMLLFERYNSYNGDYVNLKRIIGDIRVKFGTEVITFSQISVDQVNIETGITTKQSNFTHSVALPQKYSVGKLSYQSRSDKFKVYLTSYYNVSENKSTPIFFYTCQENFKKARVRYFLKQKYPNGDIPENYLITDLSPNFSVLKKHQAYLGLPDSAMIEVESLPKPPRVARTARQASTNEISVASIVDVTGDRYSSVHWWKDAAKFESTGTYYYVDFYCTNPTWNGKEVGEGDVSHIVRYLKVNKEFPDKVLHIYGINKKNAPMKKVGKWINIVDLAKKLVTKNKDELEQILFTCGKSQEASALGNVRRIISGGSSSFINALKNKDTITMFKEFIELGNASASVNLDIPPVCQFFGVKSVQHNPLPIDLNKFKSALRVKYLNIFDMLDPYTTPGAGMANIINFIDEKS